MRTELKGVVIQNETGVIPDDLFDDATSLPNIGSRFSYLIKTWKEAGFPRIGFLSGTLGVFDTRELMTLSELSDIAVDAMRIPVLSPADMMLSSGWQKLNGTTLQNGHPELPRIFSKVLRSGVTDVIMTPGWDKYPHGLHIHETASALNLNIHQLNPAQSTIA